MGQVVLLVGEPGLGKSRLVHTMKEHVLGQMVEGEVDAPVIEWRCSPHFQNTGLYPAIDFYERALGFGREEPPQARFDRLLHRLEQYDLARPETVPLWASLLSLPTPDRFPPLSLSPARQREETFRAMLEWLHARAARRPVLFIVEDLHWVDASTLEFLGQFLAEGLHDRILTLLTFRPEFQTPWPAVAHQTSLALNRLTRRQVGDLMRKKAGARAAGGAGRAGLRPDGRRAAVRRRVHEDGAGVGRAGPGGRGSARGQALLGHEIPATLQDLVMARLDRMEGDREVAQLAAVARPRVQPRAARRRRDRGRADAPGRAGQAGAGGDPVPEGPAAPMHLHLQARPPRRRAVQRAGQGQAAAVPPADRRGAGSAVPADRRDAAGAAGPPLHRGGPDREGASATGSRRGCGRGSGRRTAKRSAI